MSEKLPPHLIGFLQAALAEDIGRGDVTTALTVPRDRVAHGVVIAKSALVPAGLRVAQEVFRLVDEEVDFVVRVQDGEPVRKGTLLANVGGPAASILTAERVALNIIQRMSGIATLTAKYIERVKGTKARILDTRKTAPGMRYLDKYAVRMGGGGNHRGGLDDGILIKDNHIKAAGSITRAVNMARGGAQPFLKIEVECESEEHVREALKAGVEIIMLDNMPVKLMARCVALIKGRAKVEASGNVSLTNVGQIARTGVDYISVGSLTHSAPASDISLRLL